MLTAVAIAADPALHSLFHESWTTLMMLSPTWATYLGIHDHDDRLDDMSIAGYRLMESTLLDFKRRAESFAGKKLNGADQTSLVIFRTSIERRLRDLALRNYLMPLGQQLGVHIEFPQLPFSHPFNTVKDYENYLKRLRAFPQQVQQVIALCREGMAEGLVPPRFIVEQIIPQLTASIVRDPEESPLHQAVTRMPATFSDADIARLTSAIRTAIMDDVTPAFAALRAFIADEYLPKARTDAGVWSIPNGAERYAAALAHHTTTALTADEIHAIGLRELARIEAEMDLLRAKTGFTGGTEEFNAFLRTDARFYYTDADALEQGFRTILNDIEPKLPTMFSKLPRTAFDLKRIETFREASAPAAYYYPPNEDGSRPGYFFYNAYQLNARPKFTMEVLAYHEAVPGHHLQIALAQETAGLPEFRKHEDFTAYVEGWGLYSERLPKELGAYADPYSDYGRLTFDQWRCLRLIVDTGIHHKRWTRDEAVAFMRSHSALSETDIRSEVDRYIAWPGQACAYKIGQLKILELRSMAEHAMGSRFDIKGFHDAILECGAVPLSVLEDRVVEWISG